MPPSYSRTNKPCALLRLPCVPCSPAGDNLDVGQKGWKLLASGFQFAVWEATF